MENFICAWRRKFSQMHLADHLIEEMLGFSSIKASASCDSLFPDALQTLLNQIASSQKLSCERLCAGVKDKLFPLQNLW